MKESKQEKRDELCKRVVEEINTAKPGRLSFILGKGIKQIRSEQGEKGEGREVVVAG